MSTVLTLFKNVLRKLTPAEVDANFEALKATADAAILPLSGAWVPQGNGVALNYRLPLWTRIADMVFVTAEITWPVNANGQGAQVAGLPYAARGVAGAAIGYTDTTVRFRMFMDSSSNIYIYDQDGVFMTNSQLSGKTIRFSLSYHTPP